MMNLDLAKQLAKEFTTRADEADRAGKLPDEDIAALKASGYLGLSVPRAFGGLELSLRDCVLAQMELAQGSTSTALVAAMQVHIFGHQREVRSWREPIYAQFCQEAAQGGLFNSIASEPQMGSPSRGGLPATTAVTTPDGWCLNGHKTWSTGGRHLTHMLVQTALNGEKAGVLLVLQGTPGVRWQDTWSDALSFRASESNDVFFEDVLLPHDHLVEGSNGRGAPNVWFPMMMSAVYLGTAVAARNSTIRFALERVPTALGKSIATLPKIQRQIGEMDVALQAARALLLEVAGEWGGDNEQRAAYLPRIAAAKMMVTQTANMTTEMALQIAGGSSITRALPLERYFRDVRAGAMQPPAGDTALEMVGRAAIEGN
ncbi:MAG: acyl-CoA/acyl-ACP dehydrogenase [Ardenticatenaceae bacterium]|nr:acyl-CoA/acyl-ACP dehydrogenase [Ardenticatenaceae bacterium]